MEKVEEEVEQEVENTGERTENVIWRAHEGTMEVKWTADAGCDWPLDGLIYLLLRNKDFSLPTHQHLNTVLKSDILYKC